MNDKLMAVWGRLLRWLLDARRSTYGLSLMRIGFGVMTLLILAMYLPNLSYSFGEASTWGQALKKTSSVNDYVWPIPFIFSRDDSDVLLLIKTLLLMGVSVLYALGWRMRIVSPVFLLMWLSFSSLNPIITNTGHYQTFRVFLIFLLFADTSYRWSLDARRRNRAGTRRKRADTESKVSLALGRVTERIPKWVPVLSNNIAVVLIGYQICVIYVTSALWKLQGSTWITGTASYYPLRVDELSLFPGLNELVWSVTPFVFISTWLSVFGQLLFPVLLLNRWTRIAGLILVTGMHFFIGVFLALPWFSLMMILGDMIFIRDKSWKWLIHRLSARFGLRRGIGFGTVPSAI